MNPVIDLAILMFMCFVATVVFSIVVSIICCGLFGNIAIIPGIFIGAYIGGITAIKIIDMMY